MPPELLLQSRPTAASPGMEALLLLVQKELSPRETNPGPQASPDKRMGSGPRPPRRLSTGSQTPEGGLESMPQPQALPCPYFQKRIHTRSLV